VFAERRIAQGQRQELESLLQYMERAPVSLQRLSYLDNGEVLYRGNFHPGFGRDYQLVSGLEFLAMLVPHIALRYECRIHCYGAISTTVRRQLGWIKKEETPQAPKDVVVVDEEDSYVRLRVEQFDLGLPARRGGPIRFERQRGFNVERVRDEVDLDRSLPVAAGDRDKPQASVWS